MKRVLLALLSLFMPVCVQAMLKKASEVKALITVESTLQEFSKDAPDVALAILQAKTTQIWCLDDFAKKLKAFIAANEEFERENPGLNIPEDINLAREKNIKSRAQLHAERAYTILDPQMLSPETIAFTLNAVGEINSSDAEVDWNGIEEAARCSQYEGTRIMATSILNAKQGINKGKTLRHLHTQSQIANGALRLLMEQLLINNDELNPIFLPYREFCDAANKYKEQSLKYLDMLRKKYPHVHTKEEIEEFTASNPENRFVEQASFITNQLLPEYLSFEEYLNKKTRELEKSFVKNYTTNRVACCKVYKTLRVAMNRIGIAHASEVDIKKYLPLMYDASYTLPRELPESIEPQLEVVLEAPIEHASPAIPLIPPTASPAKQEEPAKSKKGKTRKQHHPSVTMQPPALPAPVAKPATKESEPLIKEIHDRMNNMTIHLYCSNKQKKEVPVFARHKRIIEWFEDSKKALAKQGYLDPKNPKSALVDTAIPYHSFSLDVDPIAQKFGTQYELTDKNGKRKIFVAIPGHIVRNGQQIFGIFGYIFDPEEKILYHRCFEPKTAQQLLKEYLDEQQWKVTLEELVEE